MDLKCQTLQALRKYKTQVGANEPIDRAKFKKMMKQASKMPGLKKCEEFDIFGSVQPM